VWALAAKRDESGSTYRRLRRYRWGLVASWSKGPATGARSFNARSETVMDKPMFRTALERRRCIVPADAFYEWDRTGGLGPSAPGSRRGKAKSLPWCFKPADRGLLGFAGLWEFWREKAPPDTPVEGEDLRPYLLSCTIITTNANDLVGRVHDRMPVILAPGAADEWLSNGPLDPAALADILVPAPDGFLDAYRVSTRVNDANCDEPGLDEPCDAEIEPSAPTQARLW
jgi:putative SOS response-associated peptidase YedK